MKKLPNIIILCCLAGFLCLATGCNDDEQEDPLPDPREETSTC